MSQIVETGAALTWAFFAFPMLHLDEKAPLLQACPLFHWQHKLSAGVRRLLFN